MQIKFVTLTGADDRTDVAKMVELSKKYPFVEWAILFSQSKGGTSRYPGIDWVEESIPKLAETNLSAHLCGKWVEDATNRGRITFLYADFAEHFGRLQLNMSADKLQSVLKFQTNFWNCSLDRPIILGGPYQKYNIGIPVDKFLNQPHGVFPLFDCSGGRGILAKEWPAPFMTETGRPMLCGYAGGLGPDNIEEQLNKIEDAVGNAEIWIDMEGNLRNKKDEFDLDRCERVLEIAKRWVENV